MMETERAMQQAFASIEAQENNTSHPVSTCMSRKHEGNTKPFNFQHRRKDAIMQTIDAKATPLHYDGRQSEISSAVNERRFWNKAKSKLKNRRKSSSKSDVGVSSRRGQLDPEDAHADNYDQPLLTSTNSTSNNSTSIKGSRRKSVQSPVMVVTPTKKKLKDLIKYQEPVIPSFRGNDHDPFASVLPRSKDSDRSPSISALLSPSRVEKRRTPRDKQAPVDLRNSLPLQRTTSSPHYSRQDDDDDTGSAVSFSSSRGGERNRILNHVANAKVKKVGDWCICYVDDPKHKSETNKTGRKGVLVRLSSINGESSADQLETSDALPVVSPTDSGSVDPHVDFHTHDPAAEPPTGGEETYPTLARHRDSPQQAEFTSMSTCPTTGTHQVKPCHFHRDSTAGTVTDPPQDCSPRKIQETATESPAVTDSFDQSLDMSYESYEDTKSRDRGGKGRRVKRSWFKRSKGKSADPSSHDPVEPPQVSARSPEASSIKSVEPTEPSCQQDDQAAYERRCINDPPSRSQVKQGGGSFASQKPRNDPSESKDAAMRTGIPSIDPPILSLPKQGQSSLYGISPPSEEQSNKNVASENGSMVSSVVEPRADDPPCWSPAKTMGVDASGPAGICAPTSGLSQQGMSNASSMMDVDDPPCTTPSRTSRIAAKSPGGRVAQLKSNKKDPSQATPAADSNQESNSYDDPPCRTPTRSTTSIPKDGSHAVGMDPSPAAHQTFHVPSPHTPSKKTKKSTESPMGKLAKLFGKKEPCRVSLQEPHENQDSIHDPPSWSPSKVSSGIDADCSAKDTPNCGEEGNPPNSTLEPTEYTPKMDDPPCVTPSRSVQNSSTAASISKEDCPIECQKDPSQSLQPAEHTADPPCWSPGALYRDGIEKGRDPSDASSAKQVNFGELANDPPTWSPSKEETKQAMSPGGRLAKDVITEMHFGRSTDVPDMSEEAITVMAYGTLKQAEQLDDDLPSSKISDGSESESRPQSTDVWWDEERGRFVTQNDKILTPNTTHGIEQEASPDEEERPRQQSGKLQIQSDADDSVEIELVNEKDEEKEAVKRTKGYLDHHLFVPKPVRDNSSPENKKMCDPPGWDSVKNLHPNPGGLQSPGDKLDPPLAPRTQNKTPNSTKSKTRIQSQKGSQLASPAKNKGSTSRRTPPQKSRASSASPSGVDQFFGIHAKNRDSGDVLDILAQVPTSKSGRHTMTKKSYSRNARSQQPSGDTSVSSHGGENVDDDTLEKILQPITPSRAKKVAFNLANDVAVFSETERADAVGAQRQGQKLRQAGAEVERDVNSSESSWLWGGIDDSIQMEDPDTTISTGSVLWLDDGGEFDRDRQVEVSFGELSSSENLPRMSRQESEIQRRRSIQSPARSPARSPQFDDIPEEEDAEDDEGYQEGYHEEEYHDEELDEDLDEDLEEEPFRSNNKREEYANLLRRRIQEGATLVRKGFGAGMRCFGDVAEDVAQEFTPYKVQHPRKSALSGGSIDASYHSRSFSELSPPSINSRGRDADEQRGGARIDLAGNIFKTMARQGEKPREQVPNYSQ